MDKQKFIDAELNKLAGAFDDNDINYILLANSDEYREMTFNVEAPYRFLSLWSAALIGIVQNDTRSQRQVIISTLYDLIDAIDTMEVTNDKAD